MEIIKKTMLLKTLILLAGIQCYGQALKVDNKGTTTFNPDGTGHNLIIKGSKEGDYNEPILIPNSTNWGYIGTKTKQFYRVYAQKIYIDGVEVTSDERQKENIKRLKKCLEKIRKVEGLQYNFKSMFKNFIWYYTVIGLILFGS